MSLPLIRHSIRRKDLDFLLASVLQDRLVAGDFYAKLVREISATFQTSKTILFSSPTQAVQWVCRALNLSPGDGVILSPLAPPYWSAGLQEAGVECLWCDVEKDSPVLDADQAKHLSDSRAKAVVLDTCLGYQPRYDDFRALGLPLVHDISQGLGGVHQEQSVGAVGDVVLACFGGDSLLAGPGGCALSFRTSASKDFADLPEPREWDRMADVTASLIYSQWPDLGELAEGKRNNFRLLFQRLAKGFRQPRQSGDAHPVGPVFPVLVESSAKEVVAFCRKHAVEADWAFRDHPMPPSVENHESCPNSRYFLHHTLGFPLYSVFGSKELEILGKVLASLP